MDRGRGIGEQLIGAVDGLDFEIDRDEIVGIVGPSGSGKATLLGLIGGLHSPTAGTIGPPEKVPSNQAAGTSPPLWLCLGRLTGQADGLAAVQSARLIGSQLAHFKITAKLGEGGMGEVYQATDTKLGREVAIKVLPEMFVADPERLGRFEREAKVLASLNHPKIAAIYEVGTADATLGAEGEAPGTDASPASGGTRSDVHFLVMELATGETLADRIARGPLPLPEAIPIAHQIAEALEAAHAQGIVHRDLKPANVKVDEEGQVKVLDFGLARAVEPEATLGSGNLSHSPTLTFQATQAGVLLGTAAYMSPEQAAGKPADHRADVWAFGIVLLEMITGRRTFEGETITHVIAAVLKDEPNWDRSLAGIPTPLGDLIRRCLRKDVRQRLQSIGDARIRLEEWSTDAPEGPEAATPPRLEPAPVAERSRWMGLIPWTVAVAAVVALLVVGLLMAGGRLMGGPASAPASPDALRLALALPQGTRLALGDQDDVIAISPDGRRHAMVVVNEEGSRRLALRSLDRAEVRVMEGTNGLSSPFFSPDGRWVGFFKDSWLQKVPFDGGPPVTIVSTSGGINRGATWSSDGFIYMARNTSAGLERVGENGGDIEAVTELDEARQERTHRWPQAIPGTDVILFTSDTADTTEFYDDARIEAVRVSTGRRAVVIEQSSRAQYLPSGRLVFARGGVLYAMLFDVETLEVRASPEIVLQGVATTEASGAAHFAVAATGDLLFIPGELSGGLSTTQWLRLEDGRVEPTGVDPGIYHQLALAPDDRQVALISTVGQAQDIWIADLDRETVSRFTFEGGVNSPVWSPDGEWIAYFQSPLGQGASAGELFRRRSHGGGDAEPLWPGVDASPLDFTPDGRYLIVDRYYPENDQDDLWVVDFGGNEAPRAWLETDPAGEWMAEISPDGRFLAHMSDEGGRPEIYVREFPGPGGKWQVSVNGGFEPRWSPDGAALFYRWGGTLYRVEVDTSRGFVTSRAEEIATGLDSSPNAHTYSIASDGSRIFLLAVDDRSEVDRIHFVRGWGEEVAARTPATR